MLDTYCATCSAVNHIGEEFCVGCGANLAPQPIAASGLLGNSRPFSVGSVLNSTLQIFFKNLWPIAKIVFVVVAPFEIFRAVSLAQGRQDWQTTLLTLLLGAICNLLIAPALIYAIVKVLETGVAPGVNESFRWGLTKVGRLAVCAGISWVLQVLGYALCIIPGIIVSLTLALVYPIAIVEDETAEDVLKRSSALTGGHRLEILAAGFVLALVAGGIGLPLLFLITSAGWPPLDVLGGIFTALLEQLFTVFSLVMYLSLIQRPKHGRSPLSLSN